MNIHTLSTHNFILRTGSNAHHFIGRIHGKLRIFSTHKKDFDNNVSSLFGHFNNQILTSTVTALILMGVSTACAQNLPTGFSVAGGSINAPVISNGGHTMTVHTNSTNSAANWNTFDIGSGYNVNLQLPNTHSSMLNRVTGGQPSDIFGKLTSNGNIYLTNPSGIIFGVGSQVNVGSLFASSLNITPANFISALGGVNGTGAKSNLIFSRTNGNPHAVTNAGNITAANGGFAILAGGAVQNSSTISAPTGNVTLAVGDKVTLSPDPSVGVHLTVNENLKQAIAGYTAAVKNIGTIRTPGGLTQLQANLNNAIYSSAVNNSGIIQAHSVANRNGQIQLIANGTGNNANVVNTGTLDVSGTAANHNAGSITIQAGNNVSANGQLLAGGIASGNNGNVNITAGQQLTLGQVNTNGGNINGKGNNTTENGVLSTGVGKVSLTANNNIDILHSIHTSKGSVNLLASGTNSSSDNHININGDITTNGGDINLQTQKTINVNSSLNSGNGDIKLVANGATQMNSIATPIGKININSNITGKNITLDTAIVNGTNWGNVNIAPNSIVHATGLLGNPVTYTDDIPSHMLPKNLTVTAIQGKEGIITLNSFFNNKGTIVADGSNDTAIKVVYKNHDVNLNNSTLTVLGNAVSKYGVITINPDDLGTSHAGNAIINPGKSGIDITTQNNHQIIGANVNLNSSSGIGLTADSNINLSGNLHASPLALISNQGSVTLNDPFNSLLINSLSAKTFANFKSIGDINVNAFTAKTDTAMSFNAGNSFNIIQPNNFNFPRKDYELTAGTNMVIKAGNSFNYDSAFPSDFGHGYYMSAGKGITINVGKDFNNTSYPTGFSIQSKGGDINITAGNSFNNLGFLYSAGNISIRTPGDLSNFLYITATKDLNLYAGKNIANTFSGKYEGHLQSINGNITANALGNFTNMLPITADKGMISIHDGGTFSNQGYARSLGSSGIHIPFSSQIRAGKTLTINSNHDLVNIYNLNAVGDLTLHAGTNTIVNHVQHVVPGNVQTVNNIPDSQNPPRGSVISTNGKVSISATQNITNNETIQGHGNVTLNAGTTNPNGTIVVLPGTITDTGTIKSDTGTVMKITHP